MLFQSSEMSLPIFYVGFLVVYISFAPRTLACSSVLLNTSSNPNTPVVYARTMVSFEFQRVRCLFVRCCSSLILIVYAICAHRTMTLI
jgi:hypothetical protein